MKNTGNDEAVDPRLQPSTSDVLADLVRNLFPDNIVGMCIQQVSRYDRAIQLIAMAPDIACTCFRKAS